jgi:hypothetical protein
MIQPPALSVCRERSATIATVMEMISLREGDYSVWFRAASGTGTGLVRVADGQISGGDAYIAYDGWYRLDGKNFEAVINTKRHTEGLPTWFGIDEVVIRVSGKSIGRIAAGTGTVDQCPGLALDVTLMFIEDEELKPHIDYSKVELRPERLPPGRDR